MPFISLPLEILQQIAGCVEKVHQPSLFTFSLTSKTCYRASVFLIFRQISITVRHPGGLQRDADRLVQAFSRMDSARHVQSISIKGDIRPNVKKVDRRASDMNWWRESGLDEILDECEPRIYSGRYVVYDEPVIKKSSEEDNAWAPVVRLLQAIPHLKDLIYDCQSQFPPSLLTTLHKQHPQCRLHHLSFRFRTLLWGVPYPYEMELATSPSLHKVKFLSTWQDSDYDDNFNNEAVMELVSGLAPNLKEVIVVDFMANRSNKYYRRRESWQGLPGFTSESLGSLTSLSLQGNTDFGTPELLQTWARYTDFTCLQHLALGKRFETESSGLSGETMYWVAQNYLFPRVRSLIVYLDRDDRYLEKPQYSENAVSFFQAFQSLEELSISGPMDSHIIDAVLSQHGQTLTKLTLYPREEIGDYENGRDRREIPMEFTKDHVLQIQAQCPVLEDLAIPVKRNRSSASEAEIYRCFGKMKSLRLLLLILDCSNWRVDRDDTYNPQYDGEDDQYVSDGNRYAVKKGVLKEMFINCAVDEALARSIWQTIVQKKMGRQLERLKLWTKGASRYGGISSDQGAGTMTDNLTRSWLIECVPRDDRDDITVRELAKYKRGFAKENVEFEKRVGRESVAEQVFRTIWPRKEGSRDWRTDWSSFPLQV